MGVGSRNVEYRLRRGRWERDENVLAASRSWVSTLLLQVLAGPRVITRRKMGMIGGRCADSVLPTMRRKMGMALASGLGGYGGLCLEATLH
jgi:hypothetical protein